MNDTELDNLIKSALKQEDKGHRSDFTILLNTLGDRNVTKNPNMRYTIQTATSNITNNFKRFFGAISSRYLILVPSLVFLFIIGTLSLSPTDANKYNNSIIALSDQSDTESSIIEDEDAIIQIFVDDIATSEFDFNQNEI